MHRVPLRGVGAALAAVTVLTAGCASSAEPAADPSHPDSGKRIVYSGAQATDAYNAIACGIKTRARDLGVAVDVQSPPEFTAAAQAPVLNAAVAGKPDGLIVSPADAQALTAPLASAKARGIPVVTALNTLTDPQPLVAQVLADEAAGGKQAADLVAQHLDGKPGKVAVLTYTPGKSVPADTRWHAFEDEIKKFPNVNYVGPQIVAIDPADSTAKMNAVLARDPDVSVVVGTFGRAGEGAATALRQRGDHSTYLVTFDTYDAVVQDLKRGEIGALIDYNLPKLGGLALDEVLGAASGKPVAGVTKLPPTTYTTSNINDPALAPTLQATPCGA